MAEAQARALGAARPWVLRREASAEKWKCCREEPLEARVPRVANWTRWHDLRMRFSQQCVEEREGRGYMHMFPCDMTGQANRPDGEGSRNGFGLQAFEQGVQFFSAL